MHTNIKSRWSFN